MNQGAQTWDCGELGREGKRKEGLKEGKKEGERYIMHKHKHGHKGAEKNGLLFLLSNFMCLYTNKVSDQGGVEYDCFHCQAQLSK